MKYKIGDEVLFLTPLDDIGKGVVIANNPFLTDEINYQIRRVNIHYMIPESRIISLDKKYTFKKILKELYGD